MERPVHTCIHTHTHISSWVHTHTHTHPLGFTHTHTHAHILLGSHTHTHAHPLRFIHTHTHTHTHTPPLGFSLCVYNALVESSEKHSLAPLVSIN